MWRGLRSLAAVVAVLVAAGLILIRPLPQAQAEANPKKDIVGAWYVDTVGAPFLPHGMLFHEDGNLSLTNPDAAERNNSSSAGYGRWLVEGKTIRGRFFEVNADKTTNLFTTNLVVTFTISVNGSRFSGPATAEYYDKNAVLVQGPFPATLRGQRFEVFGPIPDPQIP